MDADTIVTILFIVIGLASWLVQKRRQASEKSEKPQEAEVTLEDIFMDPKRMQEFLPVEEEEAIPITVAKEPQASQEVVEDVVALQPVAEPYRGIFESAGASQARKPRTVAGIPINPRGIRQGIIISEVLGKPKSRR